MSFDSFWQRRRPVWVGAGIAGFLLTFVLFTMNTGAEAANIIALPVAVVSLIVTVRGLTPARTMNDFAWRLADAVADERGRARQKALDGVGDTRPANIEFANARDDPAIDLVQWRSDGGAMSGSLLDASRYYGSLDRGRMVILGEPGSGKTVLTTQLVLDLVNELKTKPPDLPYLPVPAYLSLPSLTLGSRDEVAKLSPDDLLRRLDNRIATRLTEQFKVPEGVAKRLVEDRRVLPVLDGLDEMDTPGQPPVQARAIVRALNSGTGRRRVILVCRRGDYQELSTTSNGFECTVLEDAEHIVLRPLAASEIVGHLRRRFSYGSDRVQPRWQSVVDSVSDPRSKLQILLSSPLRLTLAVSAYRDPSSDPQELIGLDEDGLTAELLSRLIPSVVERARQSNSIEYTEAEVSRWLTILSLHLHQTSRDLTWSASDLYLEDMWPIAGNRLVRYSAALAGCIIQVVALTVVAGWVLFVKSSVVTAIVAVTSVASIGAVAMRSLRCQPWPLSRVNFKRLFNRRSIAILSAQTAVTATAGAVALPLLLDNLPNSPAHGAAVGAIIAGGVWISVQSEGELLRTIKPSDAMRQSASYLGVEAAVMILMMTLGFLVLGLDSLAILTSGFHRG